MNRLHTWTGAVAAGVLALSGLALTASPAAAAHVAAPCLVVNANTTLTGNLSGCAGHGIVVRANDVVLDLGGFTVSANNGEAEQAGILLQGVRGVTVKNGTVTGFDGGVSIEGGSGNTITGLTVRDNVNDMIETLDPRSILINQQTGPTPAQMEQIRKVTCDYGDGITTFDSNRNIITGNQVMRNGPFSGISMVGDSNSNIVRNNRVEENDLLNNGVTDGMGNPVFVDNTRVPNPIPGGMPVPGPNFGRHVPAGTPNAIQPQSMCGATEIGTPGMGRGREVQSIGIRVEGPGADRNMVSQNTVRKGGLAGISFHSYVLVPAAPNVPVGSSNRYNTVSNNNVSETGVDTVLVDSFADGIASLASGPTGTVTRPSDTNTIIGNTSTNNRRHGVSLGRLTFGNVVARNQVSNNGGSGVWVAGPVAPSTTNPLGFDPRGAHDNSLRKNTGRNNVEFDGTDMNPMCDNNSWVGNSFGTVNQPCVGTPVVVAAAARSAVPATSPEDGTGAGVSHARR